MIYECVLLIRPGVSVKQVGEIVRTLQTLIEDNGGRFEGGEYWGFRTLAYRIDNRSKAHYVYLGFHIDSLDVLYHHLKFHPDLLRYSVMKLPKGLQFPTPLFHAPLANLEESETFKEQGETL